MFDSCILIAVRTGKPSFSRKDKSRTQTLLADAGASSDDAARVSKSLFPDNAALKAINAADQRVLQYVKKHTAAWSSPFRIIQAAKYPEFRLTLDAMIAEREPLIAAFVADYATAQREAQDALGDLYNPLDYIWISGSTVRADCGTPNWSAYTPVKLRQDLIPADVVAAKFYQYVETSQVPSTDWRVAAASEHEQSVRDEVKASRDRQYMTMVKDHYERLHELLLVESKDGTKTFDDYLRDGPKRFHQSRIQEIRQHCQFMKDMNLGDDPELTQLADSLDEALSAYNLETLRHDPTARNDVADRITAACKVANITSKLNSIL